MQVWERALDERENVLLVGSRIYYTSAANAAEPLVPEGLVFDWSGYDLLPGSTVQYPSTAGEFLSLPSPGKYNFKNGMKLLVLIIRTLYTFLKNTMPLYIINPAHHYFAMCINCWSVFICTKF